MIKYVISILILLGIRTAFSQDTSACMLPWCLEASTKPPGGLKPSEIPQFICVTFDDAINPYSQSIISPVLDSLKNPDGNPVPVTYFMIKENTVTTLAYQLYKKGNEIANHTADHNTNDSTSLEEWLNQMNELNRFLVNDVGLKSNDIGGFRAPDLSTNENMFKALLQIGFLYDSSLPELVSDPPIVSTGINNYVFPHTMNNGAELSCNTNHCPDDPVPGVWEIPMWTWVGSDGFEFGVMDPAVDYNSKFDSLLEYTFQQHYNGNRAPIGIYLHAGQMWDKTRQGILRNFLSNKLKLGDVWLITMHGLIEWMRNPVPSNKMKNWFADGCNYGNCMGDEPIKKSTNLYIPENGYNSPSINLRLIWNVNLNAENYEMQIAEDSIFSNIIFDAQGVRKTTFTTESLKPDKKYYWRVRAENSSELGKWSEVRDFTTGSLTGISSKETHSGVSLEQNYPNPFNPVTSIEYTIQNPSPLLGDGRLQDRVVTLKVYNVLGQQVKTLVDKIQPPGKYRVKFDASGLNSGIYYYQLITDNFVAARKMILLK